MPDWAHRLTWLAPRRPPNPFDFEALDCRDACAKFAAASEPGPATRAIVGIENLIRETAPVSPPPDAMRVGIAFSVPCPGCVRTPNIASPGALHRWFLQERDGRIFARRLWTGQTIHVAGYRVHDELLAIDDLISDRLAVYDDARFAAAEFEFLLNAYVAGATGAFPVPPGLGRDDSAAIALSGWKAYGPIALFARRV
jgi:hypothetical protein